MNIGSLLFNVMMLVETGFELKDIVSKVQAKKDAGATDQEVSAWLEQMANDAVRNLGEKLRGY